MDEPTRGVDIGAKEEIYHLLQELAAQGMACVMISSEMNELLGHVPSHRRDAPRTARHDSRWTGATEEQIIHAAGLETATA